MATIGRTLLRLTGAVLLGASAASIDNPRLLFAPTASQPTPERGRAGPDVMIAPGKQSIAFRFDDVADLLDVAQPNSRVDIVVVTRGSEQQEPVAKLVLENMRLLAIRAVPQRAPDGRATKSAVATIEVTPAEAERLSMAKAQGSVHLWLRGKD
jgi:Flp pilus assembly protein CpaB